MNTKHVICSAVLASGLFALAGQLHAADQIFLKNGDEFNGTVTVDNGNTIVVTTDAGVSRSFRKADVDTIIYGKKPIGAPPAPATAPVATPAQPAAAGATQAGPAGGKTVDPANPAKTDAKGDAKTDAKGDAKTDAKGDEKGDAKGDGKLDPAAAAAAEEKEWKEWTAPPGLAGFPDHAKRMKKDKEAQFNELLPQLGTLDNPGVVESAKAQIMGMGKDVLPYVVAGCQHATVGVRTQCMKMLGQIEGNKAATKQAIEVFYAAMPAEGKAAWYQVQFIDAIKDTLPAITGQSFITVQARDALVQQGLKQYVDWYNANFLTLSPQLGERKFDKTDKDYVKKITDSRKLKLEKRDWPPPAAPSDLQTTANKTNDRPPLN